MGAVECGQTLPALRRHPWDLGVEDVANLFPRRGRHAGSLFAASVMDGRDAAMIGGKSKPAEIILAAVFGVRKPLDAAAIRNFDVTCTGFHDYASDGRKLLQKPIQVGSQDQRSLTNFAGF